MDLNQMVVDALAKMEREGRVQALVDQHIEKTVNSIISDVFGSWSGFSKDLKEQVEAKLQINLEMLDITSYNELIMNVIKEKLDDQIAEEGVKRMNESLDNLLAPAKSEYKLSELIKELAEEADTDDLGYEEGREMTMHIDDSFSLSTIVYLDEESNKSEYECKYQFWVDTKTGKISNIEIRDDRTSTRREVHEFDARAIMKGFRGLEKTLFQMYARGSKLIVDADEVELQITSPEYD